MKKLMKFNRRFIDKFLEYHFCLLTMSPLFLTIYFEKFDNVTLKPALI